MDVINSLIKQGVWPNIYKTEYITPIPKVFPPAKLKNLRNISGLMALDKFSEKLIAKIMMEDMKASM